MQRSRLLIVIVVVVVFVAAGAFIALRGIGGAGKNVTFNLSVNGTTMSPDNPTVSQNDTVTMTITADKKEEIHLHGYDIPFEVPGPGQSVTHTFKADKSGSFDMEIEETSKQVGTFTVNPR